MNISQSNYFLNANQGQLGTGLTDQELRNQNIVYKRLGKGALAITGYALAGPVVCKDAIIGLAFTIIPSYITDSTVTTSEVIGGTYGGILSGVYSKILSSWAGEVDSTISSTVLFTAKTGTIFGGKQVGNAIGNNTSLGGSFDPLLDSSTNPWWGAKNTLNMIQGGTK